MKTKFVPLFLFLFGLSVSVSFAQQSERQQFIRVDRLRAVVEEAHKRGLKVTGHLCSIGFREAAEIGIEAGFTPVEAIQIASLNGAKFLGEEARIGSIAPGKQADLMIVKGNPATNIADIEKVEIVFKDGVGYDSEKLIQSVQGLVGIR